MPPRTPLFLGEKRLSSLAHPTPHPRLPPRPGNSAGSLSKNTQAAPARDRRAAQVGLPGVGSIPPSLLARIDKAFPDRVRVRYRPRRRAGFDLVFDFDFFAGLRVAGFFFITLVF